MRLTQFSQEAAAKPYHSRYQTRPKLKVFSLERRGTLGLMCGFMAGLTKDKANLICIKGNNGPQIFQVPSLMKTR